MMPIHVLTGVVAALAVFGSPARAQEAASPDIRDAALGWATPFSTLHVNGAFGTPNEALGFYVYWTKLRDEGGEKGFAVRRASRTPDTELIVEWATSFDCPGLEAAIVELEVLPLPQIDVPTVGRDDKQGPVADGVTYSFWSRYPTWPDGFGYALNLSSNVGTPLSEWAGRLRETLKSCWSNQEPAAAGSA